MTTSPEITQPKTLKKVMSRLAVVGRIDSTLPVEGADKLVLHLVLCDDDFSIVSVVNRFGEFNDGDRCIYLAPGSCCIHHPAFSKVESTQYQVHNKRIFEQTSNGILLNLSVLDDASIQSHKCWGFHRPATKPPNENPAVGDDVTQWLRVTDKDHLMPSLEDFKEISEMYKGKPVSEPERIYYDKMCANLFLMYAEAPQDSWVDALPTICDFVAVRRNGSFKVDALGWKLIYQRRNETFPLIVKMIEEFNLDRVTQPDLEYFARLCSVLLDRYLKTPVVKLESEFVTVMKTRELPPSLPGVYKVLTNPCPALHSTVPKRRVLMTLAAITPTMETDDILYQKSLDFFFNAAFNGPCNSLGFRAIMAIGGQYRLADYLSGHLTTSTCFTMAKYFQLWCDADNAAEMASLSLQYLQLQSQMMVPGHSDEWLRGAALVLLARRSVNPYSELFYRRLLRAHPKVDSVEGVVDFLRESTNPSTLLRFCAVVIASPSLPIEPALLDETVHKVLSHSYYSNFIGRDFLQLLKKQSWEFEEVLTKSAR